MEHNVGEIFKHNEEWYQCLKSNRCDKRCFNNQKCYTLMGDDGKDIIGYCASDKRSDNVDVIFKKLEKVGEPHWIGKRLMQTYNLFTEAIPPLGIKCFSIWHEDLTIELEIKQNQEDMEEKKLNLKEFDLEAAKSGKPVCTRNGRKARIILFDLKDRNYPIAAAVQDKDGDESIRTYTTEGIYDKDEISGLDLIMLPEKHEGWVNVYRISSGRRNIDSIYPTEEEAISKADKSNDDYVATIKIEWEE